MSAAAAAAAANAGVSIDYSPNRRRDGELRDLDYEKLLNYTKHWLSEATRTHLTNFFEMCLLLNNARRGVLITLHPLAANLLDKFIKALGYELYVYHGTNYFAIPIPTSSDHNTIESTAKEMKHIANTRWNHVAIGKRLGYITPINLSKSLDPDISMKKVDILLHVTFNTVDYEIQLVPQIIVNKSNSEIISEYESFVNVLTRLNNVLPEYLTIETIKVRILPHKQTTTTHGLGTRRGRRAAARGRRGRSRRHRRTAA